MCKVLVEHSGEWPRGRTSFSRDFDKVYRRLKYDKYEGDASRCVSAFDSLSSVGFQICDALKAVTYCAGAVRVSLFLDGLQVQDSARACRCRA